MPPAQPEPAPPHVPPGLEALARTSALLGAATLLLCALLTCADIATRRVLDLHLTGMVDLTQLMVMACAFACIPLTFLREAQIEVDFVTTHLRARTHAALRCASALAGAGFMALATQTTATAALQALRHGDLSSTLALPMVWYWLPVVAGCALSTLACLALAAAHARRALPARR
jgi:TRAP-type C4-dicarboxylate transport system permease small subunit